jgi:hypothetical protein
VLMDATEQHGEIASDEYGRSDDSDHRKASNRQHATIGYATVLA